MSQSRYSIVIPCHNEEAIVRKTVSNLVAQHSLGSDVEIVLVDNQSSDTTWEVLVELQREIQCVSAHKSSPKKGYGVAIKSGINFSTGTHVLFVMADGSESPADVARFIEVSRQNPAACIFGNRFTKPGLISGYPPFKLFVNRSVNSFLGLIFRSQSPDLTNGFKLYPRQVIQELHPVADDFSITLELSLGALSSGAEVVTLENSWSQRSAGKSSFNLVSMTGPYLAAIIRVLRVHKSKR
jgi:dolichol-phosphate mannosyltransferase